MSALPDIEAVIVQQVREWAREKAIELKVYAASREPVTGVIHYDDEPDDL